MNTKRKSSKTEAAEKKTKVEVIDLEDEKTNILGLAKELEKSFQDIVLISNLTPKKTYEEIIEFFFIQSPNEEVKLFVMNHPAFFANEMIEESILIYLAEDYCVNVLLEFTKHEKFQALIRKTIQENGDSIFLFLCCILEEWDLDTSKEKEVFSFFKDMGFPLNYTRENEGMMEKTMFRRTISTLKRAGNPYWNVYIDLGFEVNPSPEEESPLMKILSTLTACSIEIEEFICLLRFSGFKIPKEDYPTITCIEGPKALNQNPKDGSTLFMKFLHVVDNPLPEKELEKYFNFLKKFIETYPKEFAQCDKKNRTLLFYMKSLKGHFKSNTFFDITQTLLEYSREYGVDPCLLNCENETFADAVTQTGYLNDAIIQKLCPYLRICCHNGKYSGGNLLMSISRNKQYSALHSIYNKGGSLTFLHGEEPYTKKFIFKVISDLNEIHPPVSNSLTLQLYSILKLMILRGEVGIYECGDKGIPLFLFILSISELGGIETSTVSHMKEGGNVLCYPKTFGPSSLKDIFLSFFKDTKTSITDKTCEFRMLDEDSKYVYKSLRPIDFMFEMYQINDSRNWFFECLDSLMTGDEMASTSSNGLNTFEKLVAENMFGNVAEKRNELSLQFTKRFIPFNLNFMGDEFYSEYKNYRLVVLARKFSPECNFHESHFSSDVFLLILRAVGYDKFFPQIKTKTDKFI